MSFNLSSYQIQAETPSLLDIHLVPTRFIWNFPLLFLLCFYSVIFLLSLILFPVSAFLEIKIALAVFCLLGGGFLTLKLTQMMSSQIQVDLLKQIFIAEVWSQKGKSKQEFELRKIALIRVESHGPICLIWIQIREQGGSWILAWGLSTGEGMRLQEKLTAFLRKA
jgi:hypothetical protein